MKSLILLYSLIQLGHDTDKIKLTTTGAGPEPINIVSELKVPSYQISYRSLNWSDFKGPITKSVAAETTTQLQLDWEETDGKYTFKVTAWFLPYESFTCTDRQEILDHENLHFSISALKAYQCNKALSKCNNLKEAYRIYNRCVDSLEKLQELYDRETKHSQNPTIQKLWEHNILMDLNKLK